MQVDIFSRITQSFSDWIHLKGSMATGFFSNAVLFLAVATILYSLAVRVKGQSVLLLMIAVIVALLIAGMLPPMDTCGWPDGVTVVFIAVCMFLAGCFPI